MFDSILQIINIKFLLIQSVAMLITCGLLPRLYVTSILGAIVMAASLSFVNSHLWSAALFLQIPDAVSYQALTLILCNGVIFWFLVKVLPGISIEGILPAIIAPIIFSFTSLVLQRYEPLINWKQVYQTTTNSLSQVKTYIQSSPSNAKK